VDWNEDGLDDIIVGDRMGGVQYFRRLYPNDIYLTREDSLQVLARPLDVGHNSAPSVFDWNGDFLPDLVVGRIEGIPACLYLFLNTGTAGAPLFSVIDTVYCGGIPIQEIYYSYPDFYDMNLDGLDDLIVGSSDGRVACFENSGTASSPMFNDILYLGYPDGHPIQIMGYIRPSICDWNEDGIPDLIIGEAKGDVSYFLGLEEQSTGESSSEVIGMNLSLARNPAAGVVELGIDLESSAIVVIAVYSIDGRLLKEIPCGPVDSGFSLFELDLTTYPAALYVITCSAGKNSRSSILLTLL
jgi:hypothetical protein